MSRNQQVQRRNNNPQANAGRGGKNNNQRRRQRGRTKQVDIWRTPGELPEVTPIEVADDPTALLRSLGAPPPLGGKDIGFYFETVATQSTHVATALALSVDLLAPD
jgi:hypothetical protein